MKTKDLNPLNFLLITLTILAFVIGNNWYVSKTIEYTTSLFWINLSLFAVTAIIVLFISNFFFSKKDARFLLLSVVLFGLTSFVTTIPYGYSGLATFTVIVFRVAAMSAGLLLNNFLRSKVK